MPSSSSNTFLRQLSLATAPPSATSSRRWLGLDSSEALQGIDARKRVMVVVDPSSHSRHAMIWALTHVANMGDLLTLLHVVPPPYDDGSSSSSLASMTHHLVNSLGSLCKACKPEVEVEALVIQGPRMTTVMNQVKKLEVSVLVLGQRRRSNFLINWLCIGGGWEELVEECIEGADCLTIGVRKRSRGVGGYLITTRWHKNFWLLA